MRPLVKLFACSLAASFAGSLAAQQTNHVVVPAGAATAEADGSTFWALSPFEARRQLLLDESQLAALKGRTIEEIAVRRNAGIGIDLLPGLITLEISLSHSTRSPASASARFADNRGTDHVVVFSRPVALPPVPPARTVPASWQGPEGLSLALQKRFVYRGGSLCIETVTRRLTSTKPNEPPPWWTIDGVVPDAPGSTAMLGTSCVSDLPDQPAGAEPATLAPGSTAAFWLRGERTWGPAVLLLGTRDLDLDLTSFGAKGCRLRTDAVILVLAGMTRLGESPIGLASLAVPLPSSPAVIGSSLYTQWLLADPKVGPLGLGLSNGVKATLGRPADTSAASIEGTSADAAAGIVLFGHLPVLRFGLAGN